MLLNLLFSQPAPLTPSITGSANTLPADSLRNLSGDELAQLSQPLLDQFPQFAQWLGAVEASGDATAKTLPEWIQDIPQEVVAEIHGEILDNVSLPTAVDPDPEIAIRVLTAGLSHLLQQQPTEQPVPLPEQPLTETVREWLELQGDPTAASLSVTNPSATASTSQNPVPEAPATSRKEHAPASLLHGRETQTPLPGTRIAADPSRVPATNPANPGTTAPQATQSPSTSVQAPTPLNPETTAVRQEPLQQRTDGAIANPAATTPFAAGQDTKTSINPTALSQAASLTAAPVLIAQREQQQRPDSAQRIELPAAPQSDKPATATKIADALPLEMTQSPKKMPPTAPAQLPNPELDKLYPINNQNLNSEEKPTGPRDALLGERMSTQPQPSTLIRPESHSSGREFAMDAGSTSRPAAPASSTQTAPASRAQPSVWSQQITETWERMRTDGVSRMTVQIQLNHNERISVELRMQGQNVQTRFFTESESVRLGLQQNWDELTARFAERGARLEIPQFQNTNPSAAFRNDFGQQASSGNGSQSRQNTEPNPEDKATPNKASKSKVPTAAVSTPTSTLSAWA